MASKKKKAAGKFHSGEVFHYTDSHLIPVYAEANGIKYYSAAQWERYCDRCIDQIIRWSMYLRGAIDMDELFCHGNPMGSEAPEGFTEGYKNYWDARLGRVQVTEERDDVTVTKKETKASLPLFEGMDI